MRSAERPPSTEVRRLNFSAISSTVNGSAHDDTDAIRSSSPAGSSLSGGGPVFRVNPQLAAALQQHGPSLGAAGAGATAVMKRELLLYQQSVRELEAVIQEMDRQRTALKTELSAREKLCVALQCQQRGPGEFKQALAAVEKELKRLAKLRQDSEQYAEQAKVGPGQGGLLSMRAQKLLT